MVPCPSHDVHLSLLVMLTLIIWWKCCSSLPSTITIFLFLATKEHLWGKCFQIAQIFCCWSKFPQDFAPIDGSCLILSLSWAVAKWAFSNYSPPSIFTAWFSSKSSAFSIYLFICPLKVRTYEILCFPMLCYSLMYFTYLASGSSSALALVSLWYTPSLLSFLALSRLNWLNFKIFKMYNLLIWHSIHIRKGFPASITSQCISIHICIFFLL